MKRFIPFLALFLSVLLFSCSDLFDLGEATGPDEYHLQGIQINKDLCYLSSLCEAGEVLSRDTIQTSFTVEVTIKENKTDSVLFHGLEGAGASLRHMPESFNGTTAARAHRAYARRTGPVLEFDLRSPGGHYYGTGSLLNKKLKLHTHYYYRGTEVEFYLEGGKIKG